MIRGGLHSVSVPIGKFPWLLSPSIAAAGCLEILSERTVATESGEAALDHPTARMNGEALLVGGLADDRDSDADGTGDALSRIRGTGECTLDKGEARPRPFEQRPTVATAAAAAGV